MINFNFTLQDLEYFILILVRISTFIAVAPYFSMSQVPRKVKSGLSLAVSVMLWFVIPRESLEYATVIDYAIIVIKEAIVGLLIGFSASICNYIILFAGRIIDMDMGFAMVNIFDPVTKDQVSVSGNLYNYLIMLCLLCSGMHTYILQALIDSYELVPVNKAVFNVNGLYHGMLEFLSDYVVIGFRICLPIFMALMILNVVLGVLAKVAPQMNMFVVGMQLKILTGLIVMFLTVYLLPDISNFIFNETKKMLVTFIENMY
ncbi:MAG: flagellar biosynthetic protein FliR [Lachnospiraceae bacterium]|nr:flagellar biosynthetic protein FliR [Lachnospiraceae bacterium]